MTNRNITARQRSAADFMAVKRRRQLLVGMGMIALQERDVVTDYHEDGETWTAIHRSRAHFWSSPVNSYISENAGPAPVAVPASPHIRSSNHGVTHSISALRFEYTGSIQCSGRRRHRCATTQPHHLRASKLRRQGLCLCAYGTPDTLHMYVADIPRLCGVFSGLATWLKERARGRR